MKRVIFFLLHCMFVCCAMRVSAQQIPQYTQRPFNQFSENPALAGLSPCFKLHLLYRNQWWGIPGSPQSGFCTMSFQIKPKKQKYAKLVKHGIGMRLQRDAIGPFASNLIDLAYAIHFPLTKELTLSMGTFVGLNNLSFDASKVSSINPDPLVQNSKNSFLAPDASFGAWLNNSKFFAGFSAEQLLPVKYGFGDQSRMRMHFLFNGGGKIKLGTKNSSFLPSIALKIPPAGPPNLTLYALFDFNNIVTTGIGYRNQESVMFLLRVRFLGYLSLAYSFDLMTSSLNGKGIYQSHEFSLVFSSCRARKNNPTGCPLFE